jgi:hypothetical protein
MPTETDEASYAYSFQRIQDNTRFLRRHMKRSSTPRASYFGILLKERTRLTTSLWLRFLLPAPVHPQPPSTMRLFYVGYML